MPASGKTKICRLRPIEWEVYLLEFKPIDHESQYQDHQGDEGSVM